jgi:small ligand-binding sensory domain FIST
MDTEHARASEEASPRTGWARSALIVESDGTRALELALEATHEPGAPPTDLVLFFASPAYGDDLPRLARIAYRESGASVLVGCSGQGVIGTAREVEGRAALSLLRLALPGSVLHSARVTQADLNSDGPIRTTGTRVNGWLLFADPFHLDGEALLDRFQQQFEGATVVGGLASGDRHSQSTTVFLNGEAYQEGAVAVGFSGAARLHAVVSQGCTPIGQPWTVTAAEHNLLERIGNRPAYEVLIETVRALPHEVQHRARGNLFVGVATDEYRDELGRGDFLIRNLIGADQERGVLAVGAHLKVGQTIQFQLRDRAAADEDLRELLGSAAASVGPAAPLAALVCACNGRGVGLFGAPSHDALAVQDRFGPLPATGFFCNGEIGPIGGKLFLHGYTASIALLTTEG